MHFFGCNALVAGALPQTPFRMGEKGTSEVKKKSEGEINGWAGEERKRRRCKEGGFCIQRKKEKLMGVGDSGIMTQLPTLSKFLAYLYKKLCKNLFFTKMFV